MFSYDPIGNYIEDQHRVSCVLEFLSELTPREREVIKFRWGYDLGYHDKKLLFVDIAKEMGVSVSRIRQVEHRSYRKFKRRMQAQKYEDL